MAVLWFRHVAPHSIGKASHLVNERKADAALPPLYGAPSFMLYYACSFFRGPFAPVLGIPPDRQLPGVMLGPP